MSLRWTTFFKMLMMLARINRFRQRIMEFLSPRRKNRYWEMLTLIDNNRHQQLLQSLPKKEEVVVSLRMTTPKSIWSRKMRKRKKEYNLIQLKSLLSRNINLLNRKSQIEKTLDTQVDVLEIMMMTRVKMKTSLTMFKLKWATKSKIR